MPPKIGNSDEQQPPPEPPDHGQGRSWREWTPDTPEWGVAATSIFLIVALLVLVAWWWSPKKAPAPPMATPSANEDTERPEEPEGTPPPDEVTEAWKDPRLAHASPTPRPAHWRNHVDGAQEIAGEYPVGSKVRFRFTFRQCVSAEIRLSSGISRATVDGTTRVYSKEFARQVTIPDPASPPVQLGVISATKPSASDPTSRPLYLIRGLGQDFMRYGIAGPDDGLGITKSEKERAKSLEGGQRFILTVRMDEIGTRRITLIGQPYQGPPETLPLEFEVVRK